MRIAPRTNYQKLPTPKRELNPTVYVGAGSSALFDSGLLIDPNCPKIRQASPELREALFGKPKPVAATPAKRRRARKATVAKTP